VIRAFDALVTGGHRSPLVQISDDLKTAIAAAVKESLPAVPPQMEPPRPPVWDRPRDNSAFRDNDFSSTSGLPRTLVVAKKLVERLQIWASEQLYLSVGEEVFQLCGDIRGLLITGDTKLSEALTHLDIAQNMLCCWRGRGGCMGNVGP
jgi:hypothetical protein